MPQNLVISLHSNETSFDRNYEISSAGKTSESYLCNLGDIIKTAQQETNQKLTEIIQVKAQTKKIEKDSSEEREPTNKRVKNNSQ